MVTRNLKPVTRGGPFPEPGIPGAHNPKPRTPNPETLSPILRLELCSLSPILRLELCSVDLICSRDEHNGTTVQHTI